jgi:hypothetical protein
MTQTVMNWLADDLAYVYAEHLGCGRVHEGEFASQVETEDSFTGRIQNLFGLSSCYLVKPPGDNAANGRPQHEKRVDTGPSPRSIYSRRVVVNIVGPQDTYDTMMKGDIDDRQAKGNPILIESEKYEHDKEMEMELDVAAGKVYEDSGRANQPKCDKGGSYGTGRSLPNPQGGEQRHNQSFPKSMKHGAATEQRV